MPEVSGYAIEDTMREYVNTDVQERHEKLVQDARVEAIELDAARQHIYELSDALRNALAQRDALMQRLKEEQDQRHALEGQVEELHMALEVATRAGMAESSMERDYEAHRRRSAAKLDTLSADQMQSLQAIAEDSQNRGRAMTTSTMSSEPSMMASQSMTLLPSDASAAPKGGVTLLPSDASVASKGAEPKAREEKPAKAKKEGKDDVRCSVIDTLKEKAGIRQSLEEFFERPAERLKFSWIFKLWLRIARHERRMRQGRGDRWESNVTDDDDGLRKLREEYERKLAEARMVEKSLRQQLDQANDTIRRLLSEHPELQQQYSRHRAPPANTDGESGTPGPQSQTELTQSVSESDEAWKTLEEERKRWEDERGKMLEHIRKLNDDLKAALWLANKFQDVLLKQKRGHELAPTVQDLLSRLREMHDLLTSMQEQLSCARKTNFELRQRWAVDKRLNELERQFLPLVRDVRLNGPLGPLRPPTQAPLKPAPRDAPRYDTMGNSPYVNNYSIPEKNVASSVISSPPAGRVREILSGGANNARALNAAGPPAPPMASRSMVDLRSSSMPRPDPRGSPASRSDAGATRASTASGPAKLIPVLHGSVGSRGALKKSSAVN